MLSDFPSLVVSVIVLWLVAGTVSGGFAAWLAKEKGRSAADWFALGFFFNLAALVSLVGAPPMQSVEVSEDADGDADEHLGQPTAKRLCPKCGAVNARNAFSCDACSYRFS